MTAMLLQPAEAPPAPPAPPPLPGEPASPGAEFRVRIGEEGGIIVDRQGTDGQTIQVPFDPSNMIPPQVPEILFIVMFGLIGIILAFPIGRAIARLIDRRGNTPRVPDDVLQRLTAIEQGVDSVAVEMERMSEANRYTMKLLTERAAAPDFTSGARSGEPVHQSNARSSDAIRG